MSVNLYYADLEAQVNLCIREAQKSLRVAVAWFTNKRLFSELVAKARGGVAVELIVLNDTINFRPGGIPFQDFVAAGGKLFVSATGKKLHHKFCIADEDAACTGSYNWTYQAERDNHENLIVANGGHPVIQSLLRAFGTASLDAILVEDLQRFHEMYPPQRAGEGMADYLANEIAYDFIETGSENIEEFLSDIDLSCGSARVLATEIVYERLPAEIKRVICDRVSSLKHLFTLYHDWSKTELEENALHIDAGVLVKNYRVRWTPEKLGFVSFNEKQLQTIWASGCFEDTGEMLRACTEQAHWEALSWGRTAWTSAMLLNFAGKIAWSCLWLENPVFYWDEKLIRLFEDHISFDSLSHCSNVDWSAALIARYEGKFNLRALSGNLYFPWSPDFFYRHKEQLDFLKLSANHCFCWSEELIIANESLWDWDKLFHNEGVCWNENLIRRYYQKYFKSVLLANPGIQWTADMLQGLSGWLDTSNVNYDNGWGALSIVDSGWKTAELVEQFKDKLRLGFICSNTRVDWNRLLTMPFAGSFFQEWRSWNTIYVGIDGLVANPVFPWTPELIISKVEAHRHAGNLINELVRNKGFKKSAWFIHRYVDRISFSVLSYQEKVEWTADLLEVYKDRWDWALLSKNPFIPWSKELLNMPGLEWESIANNEQVFDLVFRNSINRFVISKVMVVA